MPVGRHRVATLLPLELEYSRRLLAGAIEYAREHRRVDLVDFPYSMDAPARLRLPTPLPFEAALIWATREASWVERLLQAGLPVVSASGDWPVERVPCVSFDSLALVEQAVGHLASLRPAALVHLQFRITGVPQHEGRSRQFAEVAARHGLPARSAELFRPGDDDSALALHSPLAPANARRLVALLKRLPKPAAIWCGSDHLGCQVCEAAAGLGLRIPDDVAVLGTGDFLIAECGRPPLSSMPLPGEWVGRRALQLLCARLSGQSGFPPFTAVAPPPAVVRASTAAPTARDPVARALEMIAARACEGITVREVAAAVALSPPVLHNRVVGRLGLAPGEEIRRVRLAAAKRGLLDTRLTISRVAGQCGFNQQSKFSDFFRRETGLSPREWRKQNC